MTIETKFNVGDVVWGVASNKVHTRTVAEIKVLVTKAGKSIIYICDGDLNYTESELFKSKADLLNSL